jgi:hypothetical protein
MLLIGQRNRVSLDPSDEVRLVFYWGRYTRRARLEATDGPLTFPGLQATRFGGSFACTPGMGTSSGVKVPHGSDDGNHKSMATASP